MTISAKDRIIFALDVPGVDEASGYVRLLRGHVGVFKVGLELFVSTGPAIIKAVRDAGAEKIFLDMKFHDIPETVKRAMASAGALNADFVTVHCEGRGLLKAVSEASAAGMKVLGVTVLTSLDLEDMRDAGIDPRYQTPEALVLQRALIAKESGCAGVVCSGLEAKAVRALVGPDFLIVTPGIRSESDAVHDQKRATTAYQAIRNGADYIVVGRPIRRASDPVKAAEAIAGEIERGVEDRTDRTLS
ncbi:MAG: orotidine-5'-phosphate decarboxylase [Deltaproteobacteria bacterium]|nr:orotidine-5'-phosphate decarboxylase [Deltaproteobacteria bacterium]